MKLKFVKVCAAFIAAAAVSMPALAQDAKSLDELLKMIQNSTISETSDYRQREAEFKADQRQQASQLASARVPRLLKSAVRIDWSKIFATTTSSWPPCASSVTSVSAL